MESKQALDGFYLDPKHGNCLRRIETLNRGEYRIRGVYGNDEPHTGGPWSAIMTIKDDGRYLVDFAGKIERKERFLHAWPCANDKGRTDVCWADGNRWSRIYEHPTQFS